MSQTLKCAYCQKVVALTKNKQRPVQHQTPDGRTCLGSGQPVATHESLNAAHPNRLNPQPKRK